MGSACSSPVRSCWSILLTSQKIHRFKLRTIALKCGTAPPLGVTAKPARGIARAATRLGRGLIADGSNAAQRATLAALQLPTISALTRIADSSRTLRHVRKVPTRDSCTAASFIRSPRRHRSTSASVLACRNPTNWPNLVRLIHQV